VVLVPAIQFVPDNRMAQVRQVNPNLVLASGSGDEFQQREAPALLRKRPAGRSSRENR
jgi:hypothetical protein